MKNIILWVLTLSGFNAYAGEPFITVGADDDNDCDYHTIQAAVDSGLSDTIRIASNKNYFESIALLNSNNYLIGGYANCQMAGLNITDLSQAIITGNGNDDVISINVVLSNNYDIKLKNIIVANGFGGISATSQNNAQLSLIIDGVRMFNNNYNGFKVLTFAGSDADVVLNDVIIDFNDSSGVVCEGSDSNIRVTGTSKIKDNTTSDKGAGLWVADGCQLTAYSPTIIENNQAQNNGGGMYVASGGDVTLWGLATGCENGICYGVDDAPVIIRNNTGSIGGAIAINNEESSVTMANALVENNVASIQGGAISVSAGEMTGYTYLDGEKCWQVGKCNQIINNKANFSGGAIYAEFNAKVDFYSTWFKGNRADKGVIVAVDGNSTVTINNSMMVKNGDNGSGDYSDNNLFEISSNAQNPNTAITLEYVTVADNEVIDEVVKNDEGSIRIHSSIINENVDVYAVTNHVLAQFECLIVNETDSFSAGGTVMVATPEFMNPSNDDYRNKPSSVAVDYCYEITSDWYGDMEWDEHGFDDPNKINLHGSYDLGADEYIIDNDIIFKHGYEQD